LVIIEWVTEQLDQLVAWCGEWPPEAAVARVDVTEERAEGMQGFEVRR
jgi:acylphosphatase